ncbi:hypothetical protein O8C76_10435 [Aliarcobacter butzleri]|uniref:Uncharacterized protein n=1 Tax=Aliarcobacter butzleri TaxID=28197 RepID=A0AAW7Q084_9BACT|nr:hypothetical protein [Aliarcobacter butzleri]MDN5071437.1 hypothetical protein [Aliarcobacter butzleri]
MFRTIAINLDFKDLEMIKKSLENEIETLEKQNFRNELSEKIDEHKQLLSNINNNLKKIQNL